MKRIAFLLMILSLALLISSCKKEKLDEPQKTLESTTVTVTDVPDDYKTFYSPLSFSTFEKFESYEKTAGEKAVSCYYVPSNLTSNYKLSQIAKRDDVYVLVEYHVTSVIENTEKLNDYEIERLRTLICRYSLYENGSKSLEENFIKQGYEQIEYGGKTYYRWDEPSVSDPTKRIIGYEIAFLEDGKLIYMHLPAIDTFENMMKFADITRVDIK